MNERERKYSRLSGNKRIQHLQLDIEKGKKLEWAVQNDFVKRY